MAFVLPPISQLGANIGSTMVHSTAISFSIARIHIRQKNGRMWWDDRLVLGATVMDTLHMLTIWVELLNPVAIENGIVYNNAWLLFFPCYAVMWSSRICSWLSLARIYPPLHKTRRLAFGLVIFYAVLGILCTTAGVFGCAPSRWGTRLRLDICLAEAQSVNEVTFYEKATIAVAMIDIICDTVLVAVPAYLLSDVRLPRKRKIAIILLGCGNLMTLASILVIIMVSVGLFKADRQREILLNCLVHVSTALALVSANMLVVGAVIYRRIERWAAERQAARLAPPAPRTPIGPVITYNSDLTRISTSISESFFSEEGFEGGHSNHRVEEKRRAYLSLFEQEESRESSVAHRITI